MKLKIVLKNKEKNKNDVVLDSDEKEDAVIGEDGLMYKSEKECENKDGEMCYMYNRYKPSKKHTIPTK